MFPSLPRLCATSVRSKSLDGLASQPITSSRTWGLYCPLRMDPSQSFQVPVFSGESLEGNRMMNYAEVSIARDGEQKFRE